MSMLVQYLLTNSELIRIKCDWDDSVFNDLIIIDCAISDMKEKNLFTAQEIEILDCIFATQGFNVTAKLVGLTREAVLYKFENICDRIAFYLGGYFTQEGYQEYLIQEYGLSHDEVEQAVKNIKNLNRGG